MHLLALLCGHQPCLEELREEVRLEIGSLASARGHDRSFQSLQAFLDSCGGWIPCADRCRKVHECQGRLPALCHLGHMQDEEDVTSRGLSIQCEALELAVCIALKQEM